VMAGLREVIETQGLFCALYSDRGSHFFVTVKEGEKVDKQRLTQVGRAMKELGVQMIAAYSPQARGRSERSFGTWQGRLPQELRLARIKTIAAANRYLKDRFVPDYNARFAVPAAEPGSAFVPYAGRPLADVLCVQEDRVVAADNCVSWRRRRLQIPPQRHRHHYVRATVRVHEYPDGLLAIFDGPRCLARPKAIAILRQNCFADVARFLVLIFRFQQMHLRIKRQRSVKTFRITRGDPLVHRQCLIGFPHRLEIGGHRHSRAGCKLVIWIFIDENLKSRVGFDELLFIALRFREQEISRRAGRRVWITGDHLLIIRRVLRTAEQSRCG